MNEYHQELSRCISRAVRLGLPTEWRLSIVALIEKDSYYFGGPGCLREVRAILAQYEYISDAVKRFKKWDRDMTKMYGKLYYRAMGYPVH